MWSNISGNRDALRRTVRQELSRAEAAQHLLNRRRARESPIDYAGYIDVPGRQVSVSPETQLFEPCGVHHLRPQHILVLQTLWRTSMRPFGRCIIMQPPGTAKTTYGSIVFPSWYLGTHPQHRLILTSYGADLAWTMGHKTRALIRQARYKQIFGVELQQDSRAADHFLLTNDGEYHATGYNGDLPGRRAEGAICDDIIKGHEEANSQVSRDAVWNAYQSNILPRLLTGAWLALIMCMTGDTKVSMADGSVRDLRDIRVGDEILTHDDGLLAVTEVTGWKSQGLDDVFKICTRDNGKTRANARHPFLVQRDGKVQWIRMRELKIGDRMLRQSFHSRARIALNRGVTNQPTVNSDVPPIITNGGGQTEKDLLPLMRPLGVAPVSNTGTVSPRPNFWRWQQLRTAVVQFVAKFLSPILEPLGAESSALITTMQPVEFADYCAIDVTLRSGIWSTPSCSKLQPPISDFDLDEIVSIELDGREEVFDVQVKWTENFIADGFVSHNTHWNEDDPCGRVLPDTWAGDSGIFIGKDGLEWEVLCLQAQCETTTDPLHRKIGEYMQISDNSAHDVKHFELHKHDKRKWNALYQQRPRPLEGVFFHKEDLMDTDGLPFNIPERVDYVFAIIDSAVKTGKTHDGLAVMFFARSVANTDNRPLMMLDWDLTQIQGAFLNEWIPSVFSRLESFARQCKAIFGVAGTWIEDKVSGTILLQQAQRHEDWVVHPIDQGLTKLGKKERAIDVSGFVAAKEVGITWTAYERVVDFKGATRNHALSQILRVSMDSKDTDADDCLDTFTYGVALSLGNKEGY